MTRPKKPKALKTRRKIKCDYGDACPGHADPTDRPCGWKPRTSGPSGKHLHAGVLVRAPDAEREAWARAAKLEGLGRVAWIRQTLAKETRHLFGITFKLSDLTPDPEDGGAMAGPPNGTRRKKKIEPKKANLRTKV